MPLTQHLSLIVLLLVVLLTWAPDPLLLGVLAGQVILLVWTHRQDLRRAPRLQPWVYRAIGRPR